MENGYRGNRTFLDYMNQNRLYEKRSRRTSLPASRPLLVVLLGEFDETEVSLLYDRMSIHMDVDRNVFWMGTEDCAWDGMQYRLPVCAGDSVPVTDRKSRLSEDELCLLREKMGEYSADLQNQMMEKEYEENNSIHVAILVKAHQDVSVYLSCLAQTLHESLDVYFFHKVYIEIYLLVDQSGVHPRDQKRLWTNNYICIRDAELLHTEKKIVDWVYFLSNQPDKGPLKNREKAWTEQSSSIALLLSLKVLAGHEGRYDFSDADFRRRISDTSLGVGTDPEAGAFCSAGWIHFEKDEYLIQLIIYRSIWSALMEVNHGTDIDRFREDLSLDEGSIRRMSASTDRIYRIDVSDINSMVRRRINPNIIYQNTVKESLDRIFGKHLDLFIELNSDSAQWEPQWDAWKENFHHNLHRRRESPLELLQLLESCETDLKKRADELEKIAANQEEQFEIWKGQIPSLNGRNRDDALVADLADRYYRESKKCESSRVEAEICKNILSEIQCARKEYDMFFDKLQGILEQLTEEIHAVSSTNTFMGDSFEPYYEAYARRELSENRRFRNLKQTLSAYIGEEEGLMKEIVGIYGEGFAEKEVFSWSFLEEISHRLLGYRTNEGRKMDTMNDVYMELLSTVESQYHTLCKDKLGGMHQFRDMICLFMSENSWRKMEDRSLFENCKVFLDDSDRFDVLFLAGNIYPDRILFMEQYERCYEEVCVQEGLQC